jgi:hypothetical protein
MIFYNLIKVEDNIYKLINNLVKNMCKLNNINYDKQEYKILFSNEKLYSKNNDVKFSSGSKKYLCFYGKIYLNKKEKIIETLYLENKIITIEPKTDDLLIMFGGTENSTFVKNNEELLYFYVAPNYLLEMHDPELWQRL